MACNTVCQPAALGPVQNLGSGSLWQQSENVKSLPCPSWLRRAVCVFVSNPMLCTSDIHFLLTSRFLCTEYTPTLILQWVPCVRTMCIRLQAPQLGIDSIASAFLDFGYTKMDKLTFPAKKLTAHWFSPPDKDAHLPRVFISELKVTHQAPGSPYFRIRSLHRICTQQLPCLAPLLLAQPGCNLPQQ